MTNCSAAGAEQLEERWKLPFSLDRSASPFRQSLLSILRPCMFLLENPQGTNSMRSWFSHEVF
jgi:hypothetical protein